MKNTKKRPKQLPDEYIYSPGEDSLLYYAQIVADKFDPYLVDIDSFALAPSVLPLHVAYAYNKGKIADPLDYNIYADATTSDSLMLTILAMKLDPDKFWYLLMYISVYIKKANFATDISTLDEINILIDAIDKYTDVSRYYDKNIRKPCSLTLNIPGKKYTIKQDMALQIISAGCKFIMQKINENKEPVSSDVHFDIPLSSSQKIWTLYKFLNYFFSQRTIPRRCEKKEGVSMSRLLLISRLAYYMGYTANKAYLYDTDNIKKIIRAYSKPGKEPQIRAIIDYLPISASVPF